MKIKTAELSGAALDWAVAVAEGFTVKLDPMGFKKDAPDAKEAGYWIWDNPHLGSALIGVSYSPSTDWSDGGPIIERECIDVRFGGEDAWASSMDAQTVYEVGKTPLIAAMRCYCASQLGDEVEIPEELV